MFASVVAACRFSGCGIGLAALWHVGSSWTRDQTCVPCIERQTFNHWATRESQEWISLRQVCPRFSRNYYYTYEVALNRTQVGQVWSLPGPGLMCTWQGTHVHREGGDSLKGQVYPWEGWLCRNVVCEGWRRVCSAKQGTDDKMGVTMKRWVLWSVPTCGCAKAEEALASGGTPRRTHIWLHPGFLIASSLWDLTSKHYNFPVDLVRALVQASLGKFQSRPYSVVCFLLLRIIKCLSWNPGVLMRC